MAVKSIQLGQVWRQDTSGQDYLVTKVYSEVFSQYAVLRPAEVTAPDAPTVKVKVAKSSDGASLPGFTSRRKVLFNDFRYTSAVMERRVPSPECRVEGSSPVVFARTPILIPVLSS